MAWHGIRALRRAGVAISDKTGAVLVDEHLRTSNPDILAAGDMVEVCHKVSGRQVGQCAPLRLGSSLATCPSLSVWLAVRGADGWSMAARGVNTGRLNNV